MFDFLKKKKCFGLDISDHSIEAVLLSEKKDQITLTGWSRVILKSGIVKDGLVIDAEKLAAKIKDLLAKPREGALNGQMVNLNLPESKIFTHIFGFPETFSEKQIGDLIEKEIESVVPLKPDELYWDFKIISRQVKEKVVLLAAVEKNIVRGYLEVLKSAGLKPMVFDLESNAIVSALIKDYKKNEAVMLVDIGARTSIISVFNQSGIQSTVNIPVAGIEFTQQLSDKLKLSLKEAEIKKRKAGLLTDKKGDKKVLGVIESALEPVVSEISKSVKYFENNNKGKVSRLILTGGSSLLPGLAEFLSAKINLPVEVGQPWLDLETKLSRKERSILPAALGLALRGLADDCGRTTDINLLRNIDLD